MVILGGSTGAVGKFRAGGKKEGVASMDLRNHASCAHATQEMGLLAQQIFLIKKPSPCEGREGLYKASQLLASIHVP